MPVAHEPNTIAFPMPSPAKKADFECWLRPRKHPDTGQQATFLLNAATFNVNTLKQWTRSNQPKWAAREQILKEQSKHINCLFLQETRSKKDVRLLSESWLCFQSAADNGQGGCAVWINLQQPIASYLHPDGTTEQVKVSPKCCKLVHSDARCLVVLLAMPQFDLVIASAHAPHSHTSEEGIATFWSRFTKLMLPFRHLPMVIGVDANGRTGTHTDQGIGDFQPEIETLNGTHLRRFLNDVGLFAPSTFSSTQWATPPQVGTWRSQAGWHRIDYLLLSRSWVAADIVMENDTLGFDNTADDHVSVAMKVRASFVVNGYKPIQTLAKTFARDEMKTGEGKAMCEHLMAAFRSTFGQQMWLMPVDQHVALMDTWFGQCLPHYFPRPKQKKREPSDSEETITTLYQSRKARNPIRAAQSHYSRCILRAVFIEWGVQTGFHHQSQCPHSVPVLPASHSLLSKFVFVGKKATTGFRCVCRPPPPSARWQKQVHFGIAALYVKVYQLRKPLYTSLQQDRAKYLEDLVRSKSNTLSSAVGDQMWTRLRPFLPKTKQKQVSTPFRFVTSHESFTRHFARIEDATLVPTQQIADVICKENAQAHAVMSQTDVDLDDLPTIFDLEAAIAQLQAGKAVPGPIVPEMFKASPREAAQLLFPSLIQTVLQQQTCFCWRAGYLFPLFKRQGNPDSVQNYRAILLQQTIPKIFAHMARKQLHREISPQVQSLQLGGIQHMSVQFATQVLTMLRLRSMNSKTSHAVLFLDLQSAFYRAVRSRITPNCLGFDDHGDENIAIDLAGTPPALPSMGASDATQRWVQRILATSWSQVLPTTPNDVMEVGLVAQRGTRPGDPVSDLAFSSAMTDILNRVLRDNADILPSVRIDEELCTVPPVTWVDDIAIFVDASSPEMLIPKVRRVFQSVYHHAMAAGFELNLKPGKSEAILRFQGKGSQAAHKRFIEESTNGLPCSTPYGTVSLPVAPKYVHLGQIQTSSLSLAPEIDFRIARAQEAFVAARPLLTNKHLPVATKQTLIHALVFSRLFFSAETWHAIPPAALARLEAFVIRIYRRAFSFNNFVGNEHTTDLQVFASFALAKAHQMLSVQRLRYFQKLACDAPAILWALLCDQDAAPAASWFALLDADIAWAAQFFPHLSEHPPPSQNLQFWKDKLRFDGPRWKRMCATLLAKASLYGHIQAKTETWKSQFYAHLGDMPVAPEPPPSAEAAYTCNECAKAFHDAKSLAVHRKLAHNRSAFVRQYMPDSQQCASCLKLFGSTQKLRQHLALPTSRCLPHLRSILHPMPEEDIQALDTVSTRSVQAEWRVPASQCFGPPLPTRDQWYNAAPHRAFPPALLLVQPAAPPVPQPHLSEEEIFVQMLDWFHNSLPASNRVVDSYRQLVAQLNPSRDQVDAFIDYVFAQSWDHCDVETLATLASQCWNLPQPTPIPSSKSQSARAADSNLPLCDPDCDGRYFLLYLYSGHRRFGDVTSWAEHFSQRYNIDVEVVLVDVVYDADLCDLRKAASRDFWMKLLRASNFIGLIVAPPCETWSVARWLRILLHDHGPPPIRSRGLPWGLPSAKLKHLHQLSVANDLLQISLSFCAVATKLRVSWTLEHPAEPALEQAASIWRLPEVAALLRQPHVTKHTVLQGLLAGISAKPTHFMCHSLDSQEFFFRHWSASVPHQKWWQSLFGVDDSGQFRTAAAKAYPPLLNAALIEPFFQRVVAIRAKQTTRTESAAFEALLDVLPRLRHAIQVSGWTMGPDYAA
eukprot:Skav227124  [mRNA]  locus=scaffold133:31032:36275:- [translate_table: standard]